MMASGDQVNIILASASPRRQELLRILGVSFSVLTSGVSEDVEEDMAPVDVAQELAKRKATAVAERHLAAVERKIVIGADTVVALRRRLFGKPKDTEDARSMLKQLQGRWHTVTTGLCLIDAHSGARVVTHSSTDVRMRPMDDALISRYVASGEPFDKAGGYAIQGLASTLVTEIRGDYFTVVGLPLYLLRDKLSSLGVDIL